MIRLLIGALVAVTFAAATAAAQEARQSDHAAAAPAAAAALAELPPGYVIGADDVLTVVYWREKEMSAEVTVRPDG